MVLLIGYQNFKISRLLASCSQKTGRKNSVEGVGFTSFQVERMGHTTIALGSQTQCNFIINTAGGREQICLGKLARTLTNDWNYLLLISRSGWAAFPGHCTVAWVTLSSSTAIPDSESNHITRIHGIKCQILPPSVAQTGCAASWVHGSPASPWGAALPKMGFQRESPSCAEGRAKR